jgi:hypothetical protein
MNLKFLVKCFLMFVLPGFALLSARDPLIRELQWSLLQDVKYEEKWNEEYKMKFKYPVFGERVKALAGQEVFIKGYVIPLDTKGGLYALSAVPYAACFFCGGSGPETILSLNFEETPKKRYKTDEIITFKGTFKLNETDVDQFMYVLEKAGAYK